VLIASGDLGNIPGNSGAAGRDTIIEHNFYHVFFEHCKKEMAWFEGMDVNVPLYFIAYLSGIREELKNQETAQTNMQLIYSF
jgi:hypothetical protein